jgi:hypothetical protein
MMSPRPILLNDERDPTPAGAPDRAAVPTPRSGRPGHLPLLREATDRAFAQMLLEASARGGAQ